MSVRCFSLCHVSDADWRDEAGAGAISLVPFIGPLLADPARRLIGAVRAEYARNHSVALRAAEVTSGLTREELAERIATHPRLIPVLTRVLFAAGMTGQDEILDALGAALGAAAAAPEQVDDVELLLIGLQDLRRQHVTVLRVVGGGRPQWDEESKTPPNNEVQAEIAGWNVLAISNRCALSEETVHLAAVGLDRAGFVRTFSAIGGLGFAITQLGHTLIEVLDSYDAAKDS